MEIRQGVSSTGENNIEKILDQYKRKQKEDKLILIPIFDKDEVTVGYLRPVTADFMTTMVGCVELLDRWRMENPTLSPSRFPITHERTARWVTNSIIENGKRILFMIQNLDGKYIGHMGFTNISAEQESAEVDMVVRGEKEINPGMMGHAMAALIRWGKQDLRLKEIYLAVLPYNKHGIMFYQRCGFKEAGIIPLIKVEADGEISWTRCEESSCVPEHYFLRMELG